MKRRKFLAGAASAAGASAGLCLASDKVRARHPSARAAEVLDPTLIDPDLDSRSVSFENPTGVRGGGGRSGGGRKGRPCYVFDPGERLVLADLSGAGTLRHIWMTLEPWPPEVLRALRLEVFYDGMAEPSISVPVLDFFALPHGRQSEYYSVLTCANEGRGLNCYIPMPFQHAIRVEFANESARHVTLFYQIDYTLEPPAAASSYLHVAFRRENPTTLGRDFVIAAGLRGPGRFLGCSVGVRVLENVGWYGEGEVKIYRDGDRDFPTDCGTGLEDYAGSGYGLGRHYGMYCGAPLHVPRPAPAGGADSVPSTGLVGFYRWHLPDPVMFAEDLRVAIQQIGSAWFKPGQEEQFALYRRTHPVAGRGWIDKMGVGTVERSDDYCASSFVYCRRPQAVSRFDTATASRDLALLPGEAKPNPYVTDDELDQMNVSIKKEWGR